MTSIDDEYPTCERTLAVFRIYGDKLDPCSVTATLGIEPSETQIKGEVRGGFRGHERTIKIGGWFLSSETFVQSKDLRRHLDWLLQRLVHAKEGLLVLQRQTGVVMGVNCIWWSTTGQGGPTLWPEQMKLLAELNLECSFDVGFFGEENDESEEKGRVG